MVLVMKKIFPLVILSVVEDVVDHPFILVILSIVEVVKIIIYKVRINLTLIGRLFFFTILYHNANSQSDEPPSGMA